VEVLAQDVSVVIMQAYNSPAQCRGTRGTTGSGHGTRTILEFFTVSYSNQFDQTLNQVDNLLAIVPSSRGSAKKAKESPGGAGGGGGEDDPEDDDSSTASLGREHRPYINFDDDSLVLPSCSVNSPKCVSALGEPARDFPVHCCSIVSSYEDLLFASTMLVEFIGMEEVKETPKEKSDEDEDEDEDDEEHDGSDVNTDDNECKSDVVSCETRTKSCGVVLLVASQVTSARVCVECNVAGGEAGEGPECQEEGACRRAPSPRCDLRHHPDPSREDHHRGPHTGPAPAPGPGEGRACV
jgi:hypothetical protein